MKLPEVHFYKLTTVRTILFHLGSYSFHTFKSEEQVLIKNKLKLLYLWSTRAIETKKIFFIFDK